jgi:hypothetical protein
VLFVQAKGIGFETSQRSITDFPQPFCQRYKSFASSIEILVCGTISPVIKDICFLNKIILLFAVLE